MRYGLIGEKLSHSYSKEIHGEIANYGYELIELAKDKLDTFFSLRDFSGINVTVPYKEEVIKYLDFLSETARKTSAVNTVINKDGKLYGYNTDFFGLKSLIFRHISSFSGKKVMILGGDGGTARTAYAVAKDLDALEIYRVSRNPKNGTISYAEAKKKDPDVIINATPCGMYPLTDNTPIDTDDFANLTLVIDVIYNPINTLFVTLSKERGISAEGGLYMLASQAALSSLLFSGKAEDEEHTEAAKALCDKAYEKILFQKENVFLSGMAGVGKTTVGQKVAEVLNKKFIDTDNVILEKYGKSSAEIIRSEGEDYFRAFEKEVIKEISTEKRGVIVATGGGAVLLRDNVREMKKSGKIILLKRNTDEIKPCEDRPLSDTKEKLLSLWKARKNIYESTCDYTVDISENGCEKLIEIIEKADYEKEKYSCC